ncbi:MAG: DnaD domain protein [Solibacillus sp.]
MQETHNRAFKGVWIPKDIWLTKDLGWTEKLLLVEIDSLDGEQGCFASNDYLGEFFGLSKDRISRMVSSLRDKGYITVELQYKTGTKQIEKRIIRVKRHQYPIGENTNTPSRKQQEGIGENTDTPIGENAKDNNTSLNNTFNNTRDTTATDKNALRFFQENIRFNLNSFEQETIIHWENEYPYELIIEAMKRTALANATALRYTESILIDWQKKRLTTLAEVQRDDDAFNQKKGGRGNASNTRRNQSNRVEERDDFSL